MLLMRNLVLGIHRGMHKLCFTYEAGATPRPANPTCCCCRMEPQHSTPLKVIFFLAIFAPIYVCIIGTFLRSILGSKSRSED